MSSPVVPARKRSLTAAELREHLERPPEPGKIERQLRAIVGMMTEEEANELERRINEMNAWADGFDNDEV